VGPRHGLGVLEGITSLTLRVIRTSDLPASSLPAVSTVLSRIRKCGMSHRRRLCCLYTCLVFSLDVSLPVCRELLIKH